MRPTGPLHLGHYYGVLKNWLELQDSYDCFFFVADWHALTTEYADPGAIREFSRVILAEWLAVGLDPAKATLFIQSEVKEHAELYLLLSMISPIGWLERVPTYKELRQELSQKDLSTLGFLGYPVLQTADIVLYGGAKVPVGIDQVPHIELSREIVRRFNHLYGEVLVEPQPLLTKSPKLRGTDRRKMSKSYDNALFFADSAEDISKKIMPAITDENRQRRTDPGRPEICVIFDYHQVQTDPQTVARIDGECRSAAIGCVDCKKILLSNLENFFTPFRKRRDEFLKDTARLEEVAEQGRRRAQAEAARTLDRVVRAMRLKI